MMHNMLIFVNTSLIFVIFFNQLNATVAQKAQHKQKINAQTKKKVNTDKSNLQQKENISKK